MPQPRTMGKLASECMQEGQEGTAVEVVGHCCLDGNQMSSLGARRSIRGRLPGCSKLAWSLLALPTGQLAVGYLAPGWH